MKEFTNVLLFGPTGQVGRQFARQCRPGYRVKSIDRSVCDLTKASAVRESVLRARPDWIVNAAAYTAVDKAESDEHTCFAVNAWAPEAMADAAKELGIPMIHYSTDYVFNGRKADAYVEEDPTDPLGVYGRSKLEGEQRIAALNIVCAVLRTSWVYGAEGQNFLKTMLRLGADRPELRVVSDQIGAPTAAHAIAGATWRIIERNEGMDSGVYHMTAEGATSWCGFAQRIFEFAQLEKKPKVTPIATSEYPTPAKRPQNSVLSNDKFERVFGFRLAPWDESLQAVMQEIAATQVSVATK